MARGLPCRRHKFKTRLAPRHRRHLLELAGGRGRAGVGGGQLSGGSHIARWQRGPVTTGRGAVPQALSPGIVAPGGAESPGHLATVPRFPPHPCTHQHPRTEQVPTSFIKSAQRSPPPHGRVSGPLPSSAHAPEAQQLPPLGTMPSGCTSRDSGIDAQTFPGRTFSGYVRPFAMSVLSRCGEATGR